MEDPIVRGPCKGFAPIYDAASEKYADVVFAKVNTDEEQELAQHFSIRSIPTLMMFREKVILFSQAGALPAAGERISQVDRITFFGKNPDSYPLYLF